MQIVGPFAICQRFTWQNPSTSIFGGLSSWLDHVKTYQIVGVADVFFWRKSQRYPPIALFYIGWCFFSQGFPCFPNVCLCSAFSRCHPGSHAFLFNNLGNSSTWGTLDDPPWFSHGNLQCPITLWWFRGSQGLWTPLFPSYTRSPTIPHKIPGKISNSQPQCGQISEWKSQKIQRNPNKIPTKIF